MVKFYSLAGPDDETLTREAICKLLFISAATLDRLVAAGKFPRPIRTGSQTPPIWTAVDLAAWLHLAPRLIADDDTKPTAEDATDDDESPASRRKSKKSS